MTTQAARPMRSICRSSCLRSAFVCTWLLLDRRNIGRQIYAMGGNKDAAQRLGFQVFRLNCLVYGYLGLIAGVASLVQAQLAQSVTPRYWLARSSTCWPPWCLAARA